MPKNRDSFQAIALLEYHSKKKYQLLYDGHTRELIEKLYAKDIEYFGYEF
jgi:hypothetical protein